MQGQETIVISLSKEKEQAVRAHYGSRLQEGPLGSFYRGDGFVFTIYRKAHPDGKKMVIQGPKASSEARKWGFAPIASDNLFASPNVYPQIGSDEVGTGDFFGPILVVACYVGEKDLPFLKELGVGDSKKIEDEAILERGPRLIKALPYVAVSLSPAQLNARPEVNMNAFKARMHDRAYQVLLTKLKEPPAAIYQDQFAPKDLYYSYLEGRPGTVRGVRFDVKGESKHPAIAAASMIARYAFLGEMEATGKKYGVHFPLGAGKEVERFALDFYEKKGLTALKETAKERFSTFLRTVGKKERP